VLPTGFSSLDDEANAEEKTVCLSTATFLRSTMALSFYGTSTQNTTFTQP